MARTAQMRWAMPERMTSSRPVARSIEGLLGPQRWASLPADIRRRFRFHPAKAEATVYRGEIVEFGPPSQIFRNPGHPYTRKLVSAIPGHEWEPAA